MPDSPTSAYDLFFDESGQFIETSKDPADRIRAHKSHRQFASQLAGILGERGSVTSDAAEDVIARCKESIGIANNESIHATDIRSGETFNALISALINELRQRKWQPVRIVNLEGVSFGDRAACYTNMVAELLLRIFQTMKGRGKATLSMDVTAARVLLDEDEKGVLHFLERDDYLARIDEYLTRAAIRRGYAKDVSGWEVKKFRIASGREDPRLILCDWLSNASHDDYSKCDDETASELRGAIGVYDHSLILRELFERIDEYIQDGALGLAFIAITERLTEPDRGGPIRKSTEERLSQVLELVSQRSNDSRNAQLSIVTSWFAQTIESRQHLEQNLKAIYWVQHNIKDPLERLLSEHCDASAIDWFSATLHRLALTANNHLGALSQARVEASALVELTPKLAGRWEFANVLIEGMVAQAVHHNDCFDHAKAAEQMQLVADYYKSLSTLFIDALPTVFPDQIRSDLRGKALGTQLQSEIYLGLTKPAIFDKARRISDEAINEFQSTSDKQQQYQYRCELETAAGDYPAARDYLARSLGIADCEHTTIASAIEQLSSKDPMVQGFGLLHWFRLGGAAVLANEADESASFLKALNESALLGTSWCAGEFDYYPSHGILRRTAIIYSANGQRDQALAALQRLREIVTQGKSRTVLDVIQIAATVEVAALLWHDHPRYARQLLDNKDPARCGAKLLLKHLQKQCETGVPSMWEHFASWEDGISRVLSGEEAPESLLMLTRAVGY